MGSIDIIKPRTFFLFEKLTIARFNKKKPLPIPKLAKKNYEH